MESPLPDETSKRVRRDCCEVLKLLNQLRAAWEAIADNPEALAAQEQLIARNQSQAQPQS